MKEITRILLALKDPLKAKVVFETGDFPLNSFLVDTLPKENQNLAQMRTPPYKGFFNDVDTNKKAPPVYLKARLGYENQSTARFDKTLKNNEGSTGNIRGDVYSKITTKSCK